MRAKLIIDDIRQRIAFEVTDVDEDGEDAVIEFIDSIDQALNHGGRITVPRFSIDIELIEDNDEDAPTPQPALPQAAEPVEWSAP